jgi:hypothetical protein
MFISFKQNVCCFCHISNTVTQSCLSGLHNFCFFWKKMHFIRLEIWKEQHIQRFFKKKIVAHLGQNFPVSLWKPKVNFRAYSWQRLVPIVRQNDTAHIINHISLRFVLILPFHLCIYFSSGLSLLGFQLTDILCVFVISPIHLTSSLYLVSLDFIILIFGKICRF